MNRFLHYAVVGCFGVLSPVEACPSPIATASQLAQNNEVPTIEVANHFLLLPKEVEIKFIETIESMPEPLPSKKPTRILKTMGVLYPPHRVKAPI
jgi:hypothetical protein